MTVRRIAQLFLAGMAFAAVPCMQAASGAMPGDKTSSLAEEYLFRQANAERARLGLGQLHWDAALFHAAYHHAQEMVAHGSISHQFEGEPDLAERGKHDGARFSLIAENVAEGPTVVWIHDAWMKSPGHRENLLNPHVDAVGISVIRQGHELFAVEDFEHSVAALSYDDQEAIVGNLLRDTGYVSVRPTTEQARSTCQLDTGYGTGQKPWFVMRFTAGTLEDLPPSLKTRLASGKYHSAVVGACEARDTRSFTAYNIAVLLYP